MKSPITSTVLSAHSVPYAHYPPVPVVYEWCKQGLANAPYYSPYSRIPAFLCGILVGDRRDSNPRPPLEPQSDVIGFWALPPRCRIGLDKPILLLTVAHSCCALRPGWCQRWCQTVSPATTVVRLLPPSTSSGAATTFGI
jgi:hypothetical protein